MSVRVIAKKIDEKNIYYDCPTCYTIHGGRVVGTCFKANGTFYKSSRQTVHKHGNRTGTYENRIEHRGSHCLFLEKSSSNKKMEIEINDDTDKPPLPVLLSKNYYYPVEVKSSSLIVTFD